MVGVGKPFRPFYMNITDEEVAFGTEGTGYYAIPGPMEDYPALQAHNESIYITKHSDPGKYNKILKGGEISNISYKLSAINNWRYLAHMMGNRIERARMLKLDGTPANVNADATIIDETSGEVSVVESVSGDNVILKQFTKGETINFSPSSAVGVLLQIKGSIMIITVTSGTVAANDVALGATSLAKTKIQTINSVVNFTLFDWAIGNEITEDTANNLISTIITQHQLAFNNFRDQESKSKAFVTDSLTNQWLLLGSVLDKLTIASAWQQAPSMAVDWRVSSALPDTTKDPEVALTGSTACYEFVDVNAVINSVDYSGLFKTHEIELNREYDDSPSHDSLNTKGYTSISLMSTIKVGIWREDAVLHNLRVNDTTFPTVFTYARGTLGEDDCIVTFATCRSLKPSDSSDQNKVMTELDIEVEGTPTIVINDLIPEYD